MRLDRLKRLADHLKNGKLGHEKFDFDQYNGGGTILSKIRNCESLGCAIGEMPFISKSWKFSSNGLPHLNSTRNDYPMDSAMEWFSISYRHAEHLFVPRAQLRSLGRYLGSKATRKQVASNIYTFIKKMSKG